MHRDAIENLAAAERLAQQTPVETKPNERISNEPMPTPAAQASSVLTPAVRRVLEWHQRRAT